LACVYAGNSHSAIGYFEGEELKGGFKDVPRDVDLTKLSPEGVFVILVVFEYVNSQRLYGTTHPDVRTIRISLQTSSRQSLQKIGATHGVVESVDENRNGLWFTNKVSGIYSKKSFRQTMFEGGVQNLHLPPLPQILNKTWLGRT